VNEHGSTSWELESDVFCQNKGLGGLGGQYYSHKTPIHTPKQVSNSITHELLRDTVVTT